MLSPHEHELVDAIARRVVELQTELSPSTAGLVDAATLANRLGVNREYVYRHRVELGGKAIGNGPKAPIRFDPEVALASFETSTTVDKPAPPKTPRLLRRPSAHAPLLPVKDVRP